MNKSLALLFTAGLVLSSQVFAEEAFEHDWVETKGSHRIDVVYEGSSYLPGIDSSYTVKGEVDECSFGLKTVQDGSSAVPCNGVKISLSTQKNISSGCHYFHFQNLYIQVGDTVFAKRVGAKHLYRDFIKCPDRSKF